MRSPAIPTVPKPGNDRSRFDQATKETLELLTGARGAPGGAASLLEVDPGGGRAITDVQSAIREAIVGSSSQTFSVAAATAATHAIQAAQIQAQSVTAFTTAGTSTAYTVATTPAATAYAIGQELDLIFDKACGASPTINRDGLGAVNLVDRLVDGTYYNIPSGRIPLNWRSKCVMVSANRMWVRELIPASKLSSYVWGAWNPSDLIFTTTNAPNTGTDYDSVYTANANSAGTLTTTFTVAGIYLIHILLQTAHANAYSQELLNATLGGTANRVIYTAPAHAGDSSGDTSEGSTFTFRCAATAGQTLTILPKYSLIGSGVTSEHVANAQVNIKYCGF